MLFSPCQKHSDRWEMNIYLSINILSAFSAIFVKAFLIASKGFESLPARIANYPGGFEPQIIHDCTQTKNCQQSLQKKLFSLLLSFNSLLIAYIVTSSTLLRANTSTSLGVSIESLVEIIGTCLVFCQVSL